MTGQDFIDQLGHWTSLLMESTGEPARHIGKRIEEYFNYELEYAAFEFLGAGVYSAVFRHPFCNDRVLKVGLSPHHGDYLVDGWCKFSLIAMMVDSPYLPKVYSVTLFDNCYVAEVEMLGTSRGPLPDQVGNYLQTIHWRGSLRDKCVEFAKVRQCMDYDEDFLNFAEKLSEVVGIPDDFSGKNILSRGRNYVINDVYAEHDSIKLPVGFNDFMETRHITPEKVRKRYGSRMVQPLCAVAPTCNRPIQEGIALWSDALGKVYPATTSILDVLSPLQGERSVRRGADFEGLRSDEDRDRHISERDRVAA